MKSTKWCGSIAATVLALVASACAGADRAYVDEGTVCFYTDGATTRARVIFEAQQKTPQKNESSSCTARFDGKTVQVTSNARYEENDVDGLPKGPYAVACVLEGTVPAGAFDVRHGTFKATQTFPVTASSCP